MSCKFMRTNTCGKLSQLLNIFERWFSHMYSYFVGIDIAKNTNWASCLSSDGEIIFEPFSFSNDNSGFQKFISKLESLDKTKILIGLESTAHYGENIISYLYVCFIISFIIILFCRILSIEYLFYLLYSCVG